MYESEPSVRQDRKGRNVHLLCNIDLDGYYFSILRDDYGMDRATFDGHGHTIRNGYAVKCGSYQGLFSYIVGSTIRDLVVRDYHVKDAGVTYAGILCAFAEIYYNYKRNYNIYGKSTEIITRVGSIIEGVRVIGCTLDGDATYAGGIAGAAFGDDAVDEDKWKVQLYDNLVLDCTVSTTDNAAGGLVGYTILSALSRNRVINTSVYGGDDYAGGLVGECAYVLNATDNLVLNCNVEGNDFAAGAFCIIGDGTSGKRANIHTNIVHASVDGDTDDKAAFFVESSKHEMRAQANYYNKDYSGSLPAYKEMKIGWQEWPQGKTSTEMLGMTVVAPNTNTTAFKAKSNLWPQLQTNFTSDKVITTAAELTALAEEVNSGRQDYEGRVVRLGADIDMAGISMTPIGTAERPFMGEFNGQGYTISNLAINAPTQDNVGLFGCLMNAYLHNVRIDGAAVAGQNHVGVLFGTTVFSPCYIKDVLVENSSVNGLGSVGGIGGRVADNKHIAYATIEGCYFTGSVTTAYANAYDAAWAGGICGNVLRGTISDCGCVATITRSTTGELKAGLIGGTNGTLRLTRCYAADPNNTKLLLVDGRGTDASVTETDCPEAIASLDGMQSDLGDGWFYFTKSTQLPIPASLSKYTSDDPTVIVGNLLFYPNNLEATSYYLKEYIGSGGDVTIPATVNEKPVTKIGIEVFCQRSDVTSVTLPEGLEYIGNKAFYGSGITSLSLPNSIKGVGDETFASCPSLASISIGSGSMTVSSTTFKKLPNLASITVAEGNMSLKAIDDVLLSANGTELYVCAPKGATTGDYNVPADVKFVDDNAFAYCNQLTAITFPASMVSSHDDLFIGCENLRYVDFSQCNDWEQGGFLSNTGVTVNRFLR